MLAYKLEVQQNSMIEVTGEVFKDIKKIFKGYKKSKIDVYNYMKFEIDDKENLVVTYVTSDITIQKTYFVTDIFVSYQKAFLMPIEAIKGIKNVKNNEVIKIEMLAEDKINVNRDGIESFITTMDLEFFVNVNATLYGNDYQELETKEEGTNLLNKKDLNIFIKAGKSVSDSVVRPVLANIALMKGEAISTDSHRLFKGETILVSNEKDIMLPVQLFEKAKDLSDKNDLFTLYIGDHQHVKIKTDKLTIVQRSNEGNYPNIERLLPTDFKLEFKIEKVHQMVTALNSLKNAYVKMTYNKNDKAIDLFIYDSNINQDVSVTIPVIVENDYHINHNFTMTFSAKYCLSAIEQMEKNYFNMRIVSNMRPFIIDNDKDKNLSLVLPIRTY